MTISFQPSKYILHNLFPQVVLPKMTGLLNSNPGLLPFSAHGHKE